MSSGAATISRGSGRSRWPNGWLTVLITNTLASFTGPASVTNGTGWSCFNGPTNAATLGSLIFVTRPPATGVLVLVR